MIKIAEKLLSLSANAKNRSGIRAVVVAPAHTSRKLDSSKHYILKKGTKRFNYYFLNADTENTTLHMQKS